MKRQFLLLMQLVTWPAVPALFTVEVGKQVYEAELHTNVTMVCTFPPGTGDSNLSVIWRRMSPLPDLNVYRLENGQEKHDYPSAHFSGRASLINQKLKTGQAVLQLSNVRISDSGSYRCIVKRDDVDYKQTTLIVKASYTPVKKSIRRTGGEVELSCESEGFPMAKVVWTVLHGTDQMFRNSSNSTFVKTQDERFSVTSTITVTHDVLSNYTCTFHVEDQAKVSATFVMPEEIPEKRTVSMAPAIGFGTLLVLLVVIGISIFLRYRQKGLPSESTSKAQTYCVASEVKDEKVENLRAALKEQYVPLSMEEDAKFRKEVLPHTFHSRDGQTENIHSLLPEEGETVLLEGEAGRGKSVVAQRLASLWAQDLPSDPYNLQILQAVLVVNCTGATGDLFQNVTSQIQSPTFAVDDLREVLMGPVQSLLILDGYREGDREMDDSLQTFLKNRQACRVLIIACSEECPITGEIVSKVLKISPRSIEAL
ncbi:programmed cell death 1 ligand 1 [Chanos chanos]|uniref:Programmed cell death 1 ligand 1 n=1 Tax=Chanos chanos TaxID=29144 RepID=A0A6J2UXJ6_CHACN|nr:programmed cell death 1 ligand 1-like [Chanos chanos]